MTKRPLRPEDLYELRSVADVAISPDNRTVAFTIVQPHRASNTYQSQIHIYQDGKSTQLTSGHNDTKPTFHSGGTKLAFLRNEPDDPAQPWIYNFETNDESQVATFEDGATQVAWGHRDLFVRAAARPANEVGLDKDELKNKLRILTTLDYRYDGRGWIHDRKQQVYRCSLRGGTPKLLTDDANDHETFAISSDGSSLLVTNNSASDSDLTGASHVWLIDVVRGDQTCLTPDGSSWDQVGWTDAGDPYAVGVVDLANDLLSRPFLLTAGQPPVAISTQDSNHFNAIGGGPSPVTLEGGLLITANRRGMTNLDRVPLDGTTPKTLVDGPFVIAGFASNETATTIYASVSTPSRPAELWKFENGLSSVVVSLNDELLDQIEIAKTRVVRVPSTDGVEVEAWILTPPECVADDSKAKPALLYIHGGPFSSYGYNFFDEFQLAAADGYVVVGGNPRGSDGYGDAWGQAVVGAMGESDWEDAQALTDYLASRADVDADRIGIGGGSYGGYLSAWAVSHSDRYKAALLERGLYNAETFMGTSDIGTFFSRILFRADIESDVDELRRRSPSSYASQITTPVLLIHSENDFRCPIEQAEQMFATLRRNGTDVTFVRVPNESHGLTRGGLPDHRVERFGIVSDFYRRHLQPDQ